MSSTDGRSNDKDQLDKDALNHVSVLNEEDLIYGMPKKVFWGATGFSALVIYLIPWYLGLLASGLLFVVLFLIHEDNPDALPAWVRLLTSREATLKAGGSHRPRKTYFIDNED